ncbi:hypothetical protein [Catenovulum agarivorans]|uniref:hypothetical protein n=1 Tax=Catenovulum agarivorans TaxID=1172192 RepID=UPI00030BFA45|nr:hypothetical protein [Catenovulum agarivorans]
MSAEYVKNNTKISELLSLQEPWHYPVIIDNMMNIEHLMKSDNPTIRKMGFSHAHQTSLNHFHFEDDDTNKERPIAYHVYNYDKGQFGNWQGLGNVSAWARGQAWALYGFVACGTKPYYLNDRLVPKDTSAAALYASALYRWVGFTENKQKAQQYEAYADQIMASLTTEYRTDLTKTKSYQLGFVLNSATGHMPRGSEVDTPIVYGDYYFIEANLHKLKLYQSLLQRE